MEQAGKIAGQALQAGKTKPQHDRPQNSADHGKAMLVMWTAMAHAFGSTWISQYGTSEESSFRSWSRALRDYTPEQIRRGVKNSADPDLWGQHFPPNLSEFAKLCLTVKREHAQPYHKPFELGHEPQRSTPERAKAEFAKLRQKFPDLFRGADELETQSAHQKIEG